MTDESPKVEKAPKSDLVEIVLSGPSHAGKAGDRRKVEPERAAELVRAGLARLVKG